MGITASVNVRENDGLPLPVITRCIVPCEGKTPCVRVCSNFPDRASYPNLFPSNLKACDHDQNSNGIGHCQYISDTVAETLFGKNSNGKMLYLKKMFAVFNHKITQLLIKNMYLTSHDNDFQMSCSGLAQNPSIFSLPLNRIVQKDLKSTH